MSNIAVWNVRLRHQWLATPLKKKRVKKRSAQRIGLYDAWQRNRTEKPSEEQAPADEAPQPEES